MAYNIYYKYSTNGTDTINILDVGTTYATLAEAETRISVVHGDSSLRPTVSAGDTLLGYGAIKASAGDGPSLTYSSVEHVEGLED